MLLDEAYIKESGRDSFLLKVFNVSVELGHRGLREHKHSMFEIVIFKKGKGIYNAGGKDYSVKPGDVFSFSSNEQHCIIDVTEPMHLMNIQFEPRLFWGSTFDSFSDSAMFFNHSDNFENRLPRNCQSTEKIKTLILSIENEFISKKPEYKMMVRSMLTEILISLVRDFEYIDKSKLKTTNSTNIKAAKTAINYIHKHLTEPITLDILSSKVGMSRSYFSTVFKETLGESLWDYINEKRIELAMRKLEQNTDATMLDIALDCGYNNTSNFNKAFKKQTGMTPREYKTFGQSVLY